MGKKSYQSIINYHQYILKNGLKVIISPQPKAQFSTVLIVYKVGGQNETSDILGISHLLEHLMFKTTKNFKVGEFNSRLEKLDGTFNAITTYDSTIFYSTVPKENINQVFPLEAERMENLTFDPQEVEKEKLVVLEEMRNRVENNNFGFFINQANAIFYKDNNYPYGRDLGGTKKIFDHVSIQTLQQYYQSYYHPNNAILIVTGGIDSLHKTIQAIRQNFSRIPSTIIPENHFPKNFNAPQGTFTIKHPVNTHYALFMTKIGQASHPQTAAFMLLGDLLTTGGHSYLTKSLVKEKELVSSISAGPDIAKLPSNFSIFFNPYKISDISMIKINIINILKSLSQDSQLQSKIDQQLLTNKTNFYLQLQKSENLAFNFAQGIVLANDPLFYINLQLQLVSTQALLKAANHLIHQGFTTFIMPKN